MKYLNLRPISWTIQLKETIEFYRDVLGFTVHEQNEAWGWASLQKDNIAIMFAKPTEHMPFTHPMFTGSFYIETDQVDVLWNNLKDKVTVVYPLENFDWGMREFAIKDNNGYIIQFGQEL